MILVLFGPPGSGKGTQAGLLAKQLHLAHVSTGDLLRAEQKAGTALGRKTKALMNRGQLVPDEIVRRIAEKQTLKLLERKNGMIFDGYPRNVSQLGDLDDILKKAGAELSLAVSLEIGDGKLIHRLTARRSCPKCGRVYNLHSHPPAKSGACDACGEKLIQRGDDRVGAIERRLEDYHRQTKPILESLRRRKMLKKVKADQPIPSVTAKLTKLIEAWRNDFRLA